MDSKAAIIERVKEALDVRDTNLSESELILLLEKTRNRHHPDNSTNEDVKEFFEQKFKHYSNLLIAFNNTVADIPSEASQELATYEIQIELLGAALKEAKTKTVALEKQVTGLQDQRAKQTAHDLLQQYQPQKIYWKVISGTAIVGIFFKAIFQANVVAHFFQEFAPVISESSMTYLSLAVILVLLFMILRRNLQEKSVRFWANKVTLTYFYRKFYESEIRAHLFNETEIINFIYNEFYARNRLIRFYEKRILNLRKDTFIEGLKDIMIYDMLSKDIISLEGNRQYQKIYFFN